MSKKSPVYQTSPLRSVRPLRIVHNRTAVPRPLAWFRIGLSAVLLVQALSLIGNLENLHGRQGIVEWSVMSDDTRPAIPSVAWLDRVFLATGVPISLTVPLVFAVYLTGLTGLVLGYRTRLAACLAWLTHTALLTSGELSMYGVDRFAQIGLFYSLWFPVGHAVSLDKVKGRVAGGASFEAWLGLLVLQLHVCIAYVASGVEKAMGPQWWNGEAIWRAIMSPHDGASPIDFSFLADMPWLAQMLCWMTLLLEAGVPFFIWHRHTRILWLTGIVGMHLGIAIVMNLWTFSAVMIVFDVAAFGGSPHRRLVSSASTNSNDRRHDDNGGASTRSSVHLPVRRRSVDVCPTGEDVNATMSRSSVSRVRSRGDSRPMSNGGDLLWLVQRMQTCRSVLVMASRLSNYSL